MRLLLIRHGEPDYEKDSLTEKGWKEAELLADRLAGVPIDHVYVSPLGRAQDTASFTLKKLGLRAETLDWLREFPPKIKRPDVPDCRKIAWDWLPQDWTKEDIFYQREHWWENLIMQEAHVHEAYQQVIASFDELLARHGYVRENEIYRAERPNRETILFFCHFGLECVLLSHMMNVSPMILWHHTCASPSSVTSLYTEERRQGIAVFRMNYFGDISHLYAGKEEPSFAARFCETWDNQEEKH